MQKLQNRKNAGCRKQKRTKGKLKRAAKKAEEEVGGAQQPAPRKEEQAIQVEKVGFKLLFSGWFTAMSCCDGGVFVSPAIIQNL